MNKMKVFFSSLILGALFSTTARADLAIGVTGSPTLDLLIVIVIIGIIVFFVLRSHKKKNAGK